MDSATSRSPVQTAASSPLPRSDSFSGMGIQFHSPNPLPSELHDVTTAPPPAPSASMSRSHSDDRFQQGVPGAGTITTINALGIPLSAAMSQSLSAGSSIPAHIAALHPDTFKTPPRNRSVSPRAPAPPTLGIAADESAAFASSSSHSHGSQMKDARGRVLSPSKEVADSPVDYAPPAPHPVFAQATDRGENPYDPPHLRSNSAYSNASSSSGSYHPYYPLTGKDAQHGSSPTVHPVKVPFTDSVGYWLGMYFFFNLGLTLFNKFVLVSFPFPYTLTGLHALSGCAGCYIALERGAFTPARLTQKENVILAAFSVLYTINIAVSNISLQLVTVPFHQVVRASTPLFTIMISTVFLRTQFSPMKLVSLLPVVAGVGFATYGDYYFTAWGLILTLLGTFLAALKTVVTNLIQTGGGNRLKLHPLDLLMRMSPLAFIQCVIYGWYTGELSRVRRYGATQMTQTKAFALLINGIIACGLNIVSFTANKKAGALTMTVSANCKQVMTIALAVILFNLHISPTNGIGIILTLIGGGWYGYVEFQEKKKKSKVLERS